MTFDEEVRILATMLEAAQPDDVRGQLNLTPEVYAREIIGVRDAEIRGIQHLVLTPLSSIIAF